MMLTSTFVSTLSTVSDCGDQRAANANAMAALLFASLQVSLGHLRVPAFMRLQDSPNPACFPNQKQGRHQCEPDSSYCDTLCGTDTYFPCERNYCSSCGCCPQCKSGESCYQTGSDTEPQTGTCATWCDGDGTIGGRCKGVFNKHCHVACTEHSPPVYPFKGKCECLTCDENYWGPTCQPCSGYASTNSSCSGHGTCDGSGTAAGDGTCDCVAGWIDDACSTFTCGGDYGGCLHGDCVGPNKCSCQAGWEVSAAACDRGRRRRRPLVYRVKR